MVVTSGGKPEESVMTVSNSGIVKKTNRHSCLCLRD